MTAILSKTRAILQRDPRGDTPDGGHLTFTNFVDEDEDADLRTVDRVVIFARHDWEDMGSPEVVTVTIEPGDLLNDEDYAPAVNSVQVAPSVTEAAQMSKDD